MTESLISTDSDVVLQAIDITKRYGGTQALGGVNFSVHRGMVTTLFGENGAGKSTLMKILAGIEKPTSGQLQLEGDEVEFESTKDATGRGISIIHQELSLCQNLNVRDNIFMGREILRRNGTVDFKAEGKIVRQWMTRLEESIDPATPVSQLRLGQQQIVEIARALDVRARILIMDEPTSALSAGEVEVLFKVIADLKRDGVSIVYVSHHLEEALQVSDHVVVLRDGNLVATDEAANVDLDWVVRNMVGRHFELGSPPPEEGFGSEILQVENVSVVDTNNDERMLVNGVSISLREGEIVCIYGLMGAGRTELLEALAGRTPLAQGRVLVSGEDLVGRTIGDRIKLGLSLVPEDRQRDGMVQTMSVGKNLSLASLSENVKGFWLSTVGEGKRVAQTIIDVGVKTAGPDASVTSLSGGNQQKVVIGKILMTGPKVILLDEPSRGIDVGAKADVFGLLTKLAQTGLAVLFSTSEVGESLSVANRILVMRKGKLAAEFDGRSATKEQIMAASGEAIVNLNSNGSGK